MTRRKKHFSVGKSQKRTEACRENCIDGSNLLQRARTQWQYGEWESLSQLNLDTLQEASERAELALLSAAANLQLGRDLAARKCLSLARHEGSSQKVISQFLISGTHNSLGKAAALAGDHARAFLHFRQAVEAAPIGGDIRLNTLARAEKQFAQVGVKLSVAELTKLAAQLNVPQSDSSDHCEQLPQQQTNGLNVQQLAAFNLGEGWAGNTVNTVIFRHHGVMTWGDFQYTAFYRNEASLCVVQRHLGTNHFKTHDIAGDYNLRDAHNSISLGIDRDGYIHISYDHHATKLRYRRSSQPHAIESWTEELAMTGVNEDRVTYPTFILPRAGHPLTLLYRDGVHNKGSARLKTYSESTQSWTDRPTPILSGADQKPWTSNAYWNHPAIGNDGSLHLSFVWRTDTLGEQKLVNNVNIGYAWSPDNGLNWFTSLGQPYKMPITQVNAEIIWPVSPGSNLINQTSMALDSHNRPHIAFYSNDPNGVPQYQHLWFDGKVWQHQYFSARTMPFTLRGGGTLQIPFSRPEIVIDTHENAYAIFRGDFTQDCMSIARLTANGGDDRSSNANRLFGTLWSEPLGFAEPIIDRSRWARERVLTMLLQHNHQPNGDLAYQQHSAPIWLVDYRIQ